MTGTGGARATDSAARGTASAARGAARWSTLAAVAASTVVAGALAGRLVERRVVRAGRTRPDPDALTGLGRLPSERHRVVLAPDGVALFVEERGDPEAALTVVFVHGWTLTAACWHYQMRDLAGPGVRLVAYDQRGHGRSGRPDLDSCTIEQFAVDLLAVLDRCAPRGRVVLVGHSMGGMTVMGLAAAHPELFAPGGRVAGVALLSTSAGKLTEVTLGMPLALARLAARGMPRLYATLAQHGDRLEHRRLSRTDLSQLLVRRMAFAGPVSPSLVDLMESMIDQVPVSVAGACGSELLRHDKLAALPALKGTATLVLCGEGDLLTPPDHSRAIAAELPDAELVLLPGAGHMVMLEQPGLVTLHLRTLVARAAP